MGDPKKQGPKEAERKLTIFQEYFYANLLFWGFLVVLAFLTYAFTGGLWDAVMQQTVRFIFLVFGGGFTLVSVLDFLYDKYVSAPAQPE